MTEKSLFIPLKAEHYDRFASGEKTEEFRKYGPRWNEKTCTPGRKVTLSRGYGKKDRLHGVITHSHRLLHPLPPAFVQIFGPATPCLVIGIKLDDREAVEDSDRCAVTAEMFEKGGE